MSRAFGFKKWTQEYRVRIPNAAPLSCLRDARFGACPGKVLDRPAGVAARRPMDSGDPEAGLQRNQALRGLPLQPRDLPFTPLRATRAAGRRRRPAPRAL